jgi:hypothetical protein
LKALARDEYALVSLDLALLLLQQDRTAEVREISMEMAWIFREQGCTERRWQHSASSAKLPSERH